MVQNLDKNIKIIHFKNEEKQNPFSLEWNYFIFESYLKKIDFKSLSKFLLKKKKDILKLPTSFDNTRQSDGLTGLGNDSTTARFKHYNVLNWKNKNIVLIKKAIRMLHNEALNQLNLPVPKEIYIQCWVNIMNKGQKIKCHSHGYTPNIYLGGHICVQCDNTSTYYVNPVQQLDIAYTYKSKNEIGKITMFQGHLPHYTDEHNTEKERITLAFDIVTDPNVLITDKHYIKI